MECPQCGRPVGNWMRICGACGAPLATLPASPASGGPVAAPAARGSIAQAAPGTAPPAPVPRPATARRFWPRWLTVLLAVLTFGALVLIASVVVLVFYLHASVLKHPDNDTYRWERRAGESRPMASLFFDNGAAQSLTVDLPGQGHFTVAPGQCVRLWEPAGPLECHVTAAPDASGRPLEITAQGSDVTLHQQLEADHVYVLNPGAIFDYVIESQSYSAIPMPLMGGGPDPKYIRGQSYFDAGTIDYPFQPAPASVEVPSYGGIYTKTTLNHTPHAAATTEAGGATETSAAADEATDEATDIRAEVAATVAFIAPEGHVAAGDVLVRLEDAPFRALLEQERAKAPAPDDTDGTAHQAAIAAAQRAVDQCVIRAPAAGQVVQKKVDVGEIVEDGETLMTFRKATAD